MKRHKNSISIDINAPISEAYKVLRTNIQYSSMENKIQTIVVTSALPGEGKTTTSLNLAMAMAQSGHKTLLIDCDLRKPNVHKVFGLPNNKGISELLIEENSIEDMIYETEVGNKNVENLYLLLSGFKPPNPSELLGSNKMRDYINSFKKIYDYIIIDSPPVLIVTDAQILSQYADGCLLVVSSGKTHKDEALKAKAQLMKVNANLLGVVLNKLKVKGKDRYSDYY